MRQVNLIFPLVAAKATLAFHRPLNVVRRSFPKLPHTLCMESTSSENQTIDSASVAATPSVVVESVSSNRSIWEEVALSLVGGEPVPANRMQDYVQYITLLRVGIPASFNFGFAKLLYPIAASTLAAVIHDSGVFAVVAQDASQYIQNILTTSGLVFSLLVGYTYYFMYQQQEATYLALYQEVTMAKSLLEQVALVCQGREQLYQRILLQIDRYVRDDLRRFNDVEPAILLSALPSEDPLEDILYLTSVGEPSAVYQTVRSLRQARAYRLGALQRKLPDIHMTLLWVLAGIVLFTFPLLGAGVQTIGGAEILEVQSYYLGFIVFGMSLVMGVIYELQRPGEAGAYNARTVLAVMVGGLEQELKQRLAGQAFPSSFSSPFSQTFVDIDGPSIDDNAVNSFIVREPSIDADGAFDTELLLSRESSNL